MKTLGTLSMAVLLLLVAGSARIYAQDADRPPQAQDEKTKPNDKDKEKEKDKDKNKGGMQEERRDKDQPNMKQDEHRDRQQDQKEQRNDQRMDQRQDQKMERNEHQHPAAAKGKKIPDEKFKQSFGRQHTFKVQRTTIINNPQPVVVYGGYNFQLVEAWPSVWGFDDPVYVDYDPMADEYFLINEVHPDVRISVMVVGGF